MKHLYSEQNTMEIKRSSKIVQPDYLLNPSSAANIFHFHLQAIWSMVFYGMAKDLVQKIREEESLI